MVDAIVLSPTDAGSQKGVVGSAQRVVVARARAPRDSAVQHCIEYLDSEHPDFELEGNARSVVQFEGVLPKAAPCVAYAPIDLDGQVGIVVGVPLEVCHVCGHTYSKSMDQPGKVANPTHGHMYRENGYFPVRVRA